MAETSKNATGNSENFLTSELQNKYEVTKAVVSSRLKALQIEPYKQDNRFYITSAQLQLMDDLHAYLQAGGKIDEFVQQQITVDKIVSPQTEVIVVQSETQTTTTPQSQQEHQAIEEIASFELTQQEMIENLQAQKGEQVSRQDIQEVHERAQQRAFVKATAEETLTLIYEATEEFTIPGLKEQLDKHREACRQARGKRTAGHNVNDFLSKSLAFQTQIGTNGSAASANYNSNQSPT